MQTMTTITQKGQITLPKKMRDMFGMDQFDKVIVKIENDHIAIKPSEDILDLAGRYKKR